MDAPTDYIAHSPVTDPGRHRELLRAVPPDPLSLHQVATRTLVHYRAGTPAVTPEQLLDIDNRWISVILETAQARAAGPLGGDRESAARVGGCCRDFALLAVAILREHGIPARTRIGFAGYFTSDVPGFHHDHVVAERWDGHRWVRFDVELTSGEYPFDVADIPQGPGAPFRTAAEVWRDWRAGDLDAELFGVDPSLPELSGPALIQRYVILEAAHLMKQETLLWDEWGAMTIRPGPGASGGIEPGGIEPGTADLTDRVAALLIGTTEGTGASSEASAVASAVAELAQLWRREDRLRPGRWVRTWSPAGRVGQTDLQTQQTDWSRGGLDLTAASPGSEAGELAGQIGQ